MSASGTEPKAHLYRIDVGRCLLEPVGEAALSGIGTSAISVNNQYYACGSASTIEFFEIQNNQRVSSLQVPNDTIASLLVLPHSQDQTKKYLIVAGASSQLLVFKIDLLLKCKGI